MRRQRTDRGFTLLDMTIVMVIMGILGMLAIPQFDSMMTEARLNAATTEVVSALEYAKSLAACHNRVFVFLTFQTPPGMPVGSFPYDFFETPSGDSFVVLDKRYMLDSSPHHDAEPPVGAYGAVFDPLDKDVYVKSFETTQAREVAKVVAAPGSSQVRFYPDGHSGGTDRTLTVRYGNRERTVSVAGTTGRITVD